MTEITRILSAVEHGDPSAAAQLLPLVYDELRQLAAARLAREKPGQTLDATSLVHEAYMRLVDVKQARDWNSRGHFFAACAEAMRRILVEAARHKQSARAGGGRRRVALGDVEAEAREPEDELALDEALTNLAAEDAVAAEIAKLRLYAGLSVAEAADALAISRAQGHRHWAYARAWLSCALDDAAGAG